MATHSGALAWRIPGTGEPGGLPSMGSHRVGTEATAAAAALGRKAYSLLRACLQDLLPQPLEESDLPKTFHNVKRELIHFQIPNKASTSAGKVPLLTPLLPSLWPHSSKKKPEMATFKVQTDIIRWDSHVIVPTGHSAGSSGLIIADFVHVLYCISTRQDRKSVV